MGAGIHAGHAVVAMTVGVIFSRYDLPLLKGRMLRPLQWGVILIGASVPVSVALDNLLLALLLLGALFSLGSISRIALAHPVARAALLLFASLLLATAYGDTPLAAAFSILGKYADLLFIPVFIFLLTDETVRRRARHAFLAVMGLTLLLSFLVGAGWLSLQTWMWAPDTDNPAIFHSHITQNNMMAFAVFLALLRLRDAASGSVRAAWGLFALLGIINVLFMVQGRTGHLIMLVLMAWFAWSTLGRAMRRRGRRLDWRHGFAVLLTMAMLSVTAYQLSPRLHDRIGLAFSEFSAWEPGHGKDTSTGQRLDFNYYTLQMVQQQPLLGVGTGGFPAAFAQQVEGTETRRTKHPHNEYLMIASQTGLLGLLLLLYLFYTLWRNASRLPAFEQEAARGLVLAYLVNALLNCALLDHSDGLFFSFMAAVLFAGLQKDGYVPRPHDHGYQR